MNEEKRKYKLNLELYNCVLYDGENPYQLDYVIEGEKYYFKLRTNEGFKIKNSPSWTMGNDSGNFYLQKDRTISTIKGSEPIVITNDLTIQANATISGTLKYGFVNVYNPTNEEVEKLSKKLWFKSTGFLKSRGGDGNFEDLRQYIISFRKLYIDIPLYYDHGSLNNSGVNDNLLYMGELQPYIEVRTNRQYQTMDQKLLNNNLWCKLSDINGYAVLNDIELKPINKINHDEYEEIITILQSGVIF